MMKLPGIEGSGGAFDGVVPVAINGKAMNGRWVLKNVIENLLTKDTANNLVGSY